MSCFALLIIHVISASNPDLRTVQTQTAWTYSWNPYSPVSPISNQEKSFNSISVASNSSRNETSRLLSPIAPSMPVACLSAALMTPERKPLAIDEPSSEKKLSQANESLSSKMSNWCDDDPECDKVDIIPYVPPRATPLPPDSKPLSEDIYIRLLPSTISRKYKGRYINLKKTSDEQQLYAMNDLWVLLGPSPPHKYAEKLLQRFSEDMFAGNKTHHPIIQSYYISLWANVDIYYAMNFILNAFCTGFDEVAVVTLLKQLTAFSGDDGKYVGIIKAIWNKIFHHDGLKHAVLNYANKNVASYSLLTLAVHDYDMHTLMKLFDEAIETGHQITLSTFHCIVSRIAKLKTWHVTAKHLSMIRIIWRESIPLLRDRMIHGRSNERWFQMMFRVCDKFNLKDLRASMTSSELYKQMK